MVHVNLITLGHENGLFRILIRLCSYPLTHARGSISFREKRNVRGLSGVGARSGQ